MRRLLARDMLGAAIAKAWRVDAGKQMLASAEQHGRYGEMQFVDEAGGEVLADGGGAAAEPDILALGAREGALQRRLDAVGDEMKGRAAFHLDRRARMVGQHEDGRVIGRVVAPPAFPALIRPGAADWAEHVTAEDPGPDILEATAR